MARLRPVLRVSRLRTWEVSCRRAERFSRSAAPRVPARVKAMPRRLAHECAMCTLWVVSGPEKGVPATTCSSATSFISIAMTTSVSTSSSAGSVVQVTGVVALAAAMVPAVMPTAPAVREALRTSASASGGPVQAAVVGLQRLEVAHGEVPGRGDDDLARPAPRRHRLGPRRPTRPGRQPAEAAELRDRGPLAPRQDGELLGEHLVDLRRRQPDRLVARVHAPSLAPTHASSPAPHAFWGHDSARDAPKPSPEDEVRPCIGRAPARSTRRPRSGVAPRRAR